MDDRSRSRRPRPHRGPPPGGSKRPRPGAGTPPRREPQDIHGLSREWVDELRNTVRPGQFDQATALVSKSLESFAAEDYQRASSLAERAKASAQRSGRVRELLGLALYHAGNYREAVRELLTYRRLTGLVDQNHVIADCYRALGRPERALEVCHEVAPERVSPEIWAEVLIVSASTLADQGDLERALAQTDRGELKPGKIEPYHLRLWYVRADLLERAARHREAAALWERISAEDPQFFDVAERLRAAQAGNA